MRRLAPQSSVLALGALLLLSSVTCGIRQDELRCEEAVAHLAGCCPDFDPHLVDCQYQPAEGCMAEHRPDIPVDAAQCITSLDCAAIEKNDLCNRVRQVAANNRAGLTTQNQTATCP